MDDIAIHTKWENHEMDQQHIHHHHQYVHHMLNKLEQNDLYLKPEKCNFEQKEIDYLSVIIGNGKLQMDLKKLKGIADWPKPKTPTDIHTLLDLTKKVIIWNWGESQQCAFKELKTHMW